MRREYILLTIVFALLLAAGQAECGYRLESFFIGESSRFWYTVEVASGAPPPFQDLHIETHDTNPANYELIVAPEGWQMSLVPRGDGTAWISLYGPEPLTYAFFKIQYSGESSIHPGVTWVLTEDGDPDADTGVIPDEGGEDAVGPWRGITNPDIKVAVHVLPHEDRSCNRNFPVLTDCSDIVATCSANDVDFFPVFFGFNEYQGFEYSVDWPGSYSCIFTSCSYSNFGDIVWPAGTVPIEEWTDRITHAYDTCQHGTIAIPGWGWIYEPGPAAIRIVDNSAFHSLGVLDCEEGVELPGCNFAAGIGGATGEEPCGPSGTEPTAWGAVKAMFK